MLLWHRRGQERSDARLGSRRLGRETARPVLRRRRRCGRVEVRGRLQCRLERSRLGVEPLVGGEETGLRRGLEVRRMREIGGRR